MSMNSPSSWNVYQGKDVQGTTSAATTAFTPPVSTTTPATTTTYTTTANSSSLSMNHSSPAETSTTSSSYSSWTVPSLDGLFSARRASAFGLRYGLSSAAGTMVGGGNGGGPGGGRISPAPSTMSMMIEGNSSGVSLQIKARKLSLHMSETITGSLNDSSLVFYRVNEHVHKKVPLLVQEKKALMNIRRDVETANQDMEDAQQTISSLQRVTEFGTIEALVQRSLAAVHK
ncbi:hypothetical protein FBU30_005797 [Linnemannia zychae]|nr:hypothetical protein FBU30_005797 [Linnemannia zychae]